jgi:hypothetical protein
MIDVDEAGVEETRSLDQPRRVQADQLRAPGRRRAGRRWLLSLLAALAGALLIAGITTAVHPVSFSSSSSSSSSSLAGGVPRYYVTVYATGNQLRAEVHSSASGRLAGSVSLPVSRRSGTVWQVAGAADDRHFVIAIPAYGTSSFTVFGLSVTSSGHPELWKQRTVRWGGDVFRSLALSPDGAVVALDFTNSTHFSGYVRVLNLGTGETRNWSGAEAPGFLPGDLSFLSRTTLAVPWVHYLSQAKAVLAGVRMLDVSRHSGSLLAASRLVAFRVPPAAPDSGIVTAGGRQIIASFCPAGTGRTVTSRVTVLSGTDGHLITVLRTEKMTLAGPARTADGTQTLGLVSCPVLSVDSSGQHMLTWAFTFGRLDHGKFRHLPKGGGSFAAAW